MALCAPLRVPGVRGCAAGDAAGCGGEPGTAGIGFYNTLRRSGTKTLWGAWDIPYLDEYGVDPADMTSGSLPSAQTTQSINVYETISMVVQLDLTCGHLTSLAAAIRAERQSDPSFPPSHYDHPLHFHLFTDNMSAMCWLTKHKTSSPLNSFIIRLFAQIRARYGVVVTIGHIPGKANTLADAISRGFRVPNGDQLRSLLSAVPRTPLLPPWWQSLPRTAPPSTSTT